MDSNKPLESILAQFDYQLPMDRIAHTPANPRDSSKLLCIDRNRKILSHRHFYDLANLIDSHSILVINNTKVYPARLIGRKKTGGKVEVLLAKDMGSNRWEAMSKPGIPKGERIYFDQFELEVVDRIGKLITVQPSVESGVFIKLIELVGDVPIPPYIKPTLKKTELHRRYQTVYAEETGSAAAPTAGLHFTPEVFDSLRDRGVDIVTVTLHVGLGTFAPVDEDDIKNGSLHKEYIEITNDEAHKINQAKSKGKKIYAVGTTSARTLESAADKNGIVQPVSGETSLFIYPGYKFRIVDGLITNFHVPKSSLLMLVSAFCSYPNTDSAFVDFQNSLMGEAYKEAIKENYRFFSFGDASFIY